MITKKIAVVNEFGELKSSLMSELSTLYPCHYFTKPSPLHTSLEEIWCEGKEELVYLADAFALGFITAHRK